MPHHHHQNQTFDTAYYAERGADAIAWQPWSEATLRKARQRGKLIFLNIGYTGCYWCERMASEVFRHPVGVAYIHRYFVPVTLDRAQRPDIANAFMQVVAAMTGKTGWPLTVILTPEGKPFHGGTYFSFESEVPGSPSLHQLLREALEAWEKDRPRVEDTANEMARQMREGMLPLLEAPLPQPGDVDAVALTAVEADYEPQSGGFDQGPKFPRPLLLLWLLHLAEKGHDRAREMALTTLIGMARGGIYDVLGGGFHEYARDAAWREPCFEKSLPTNALLGLAYARAYRLTGQAAFHRVAASTFDYILRELRLPNGLLVNGQGSESLHHGDRGAYYLWTAEEVRAALPPKEAEALVAAYDLGNAAATLQRALSDEALASRLGIAPAEAAERLAAAKTHLQEARQHRTPPITDTTVTTVWHALATRAFAEAARLLDAPRYAEAAAQGGAALLTHLRTADGLARNWYEDRATGAGLLEDHAAVALAMLALHRLDAPPPTPETSWLYEATQCLETLTHRFAADWGYYDTDAAHFTPFGRTQEIVDGVTPSSNALAVTLLLEFAAATHQPAFQNLAAAMLSRLTPAMAKYPTAFPQWLIARLSLGPQKL